MSGERSVRVEGSLEGIPTDVTFTFPGEGGATLQAHTFVLAVASDVFKANFFGGLPREEMVAIVDTSRAAFAMFMDLLYGRHVPLDQLALTRLLALSELEDRYLVHQRRVLEAVAERPWTPEDAVEVLHLAASEEFAAAVGEAMEGALRERREERVALAMSVNMDWESYYDMDSTHAQWKAHMDVSNGVTALVEKTVMESSKLKEVRAMLAAPLAHSTPSVTHDSQADHDGLEKGVKHWLEESKLEETKVNIFCKRLAVRARQLVLKLELVQALQHFPEETKISIEQQINQLQKVHEEEASKIYEDQELEFHLRQEMALDLQMQHKFLQLQQLGQLVRQKEAELQEQAGEIHQAEQQQ